MCYHGGSTALLNSQGKSSFSDKRGFEWEPLYILGRGSRRIGLGAMFIENKFINIGRRKVLFFEPLF